MMPNITAIELRLYDVLDDAKLLELAVDDQPSAEEVERHLRAVTKAARHVLESLAALSAAFHGDAEGKP